MISIATRGLMLSLGLVLASAFVAGPARAGVSLWGGPNCSDPSTIASHFASLDYTGLDRCEAMCKIAIGVCRSSVKNAVSCMKDETTSYYNGIVAGYCSPLTGAEKASCLANVKVNRAASKDYFAGLKDTALASCETYLENCLMACSAPVL